MAENARFPTDRQWVLVVWGDPTHWYGFGPFSEEAEAEAAAAGYPIWKVTVVEVEPLPDWVKPIPTVHDVLGRDISDMEPQP